jgi:CRISPR-associated protein Csb2
MQRFLCISVMFLLDRFHGRAAGDRAAEWPPSPLRLFQALVAAAHRGRGQAALPEAQENALGWLGSLCEHNPPVIIASPSRKAKPYVIAVPNNDLDVWARPLAEGHEPKKQPAELRTMKTVRPTAILDVTSDTDADLTVRFIWPLNLAEASEDAEPFKSIRCLVRRVVAVGWGLDLVAADARILDLQEVTELHGERWQPTKPRGGSPVDRPLPVNGTLNALRVRHDRWLGRVNAISRQYDDVPPYIELDDDEAPRLLYAYTPESALPPRPFAAFFLRPIDGGGNFAAISQDRAVQVAAMLRHAACEAAKGDLDEEGWRTEEWGRRFVAGHGQDKSNNRRARDDNYPRFSYLPLPTIDPRGVASNIRRVIIAEPFGGDGQSIEWAINRLAGSPLYKEPPRASWAELFQSSEQPASDDVDQARQAAVKYLSGLHPCQRPSARDLKRWLYHQPRPHGEYRVIWSHVKKVCAKIEAIQPSPQQAAHNAVALLEALTPDYVVRRYIETCGTWTSVTPVILPRYVARTELEGIDALLRQCLQDAALPFGERDVVIESRPTSWIAGVPSGVQFKRPTYLRNLPAVHIRLCFRNAISGPIAIGAGRHCGLGLCAGM